jgi:glycolate oxidase iron-sulfur subunit
MKTIIAKEFADQPLFDPVKGILQSCVHCGFCTATCPTYLLLGDERDSPRGRIYMMKAMFEGEPVTQETRHHLDRCLTCRSCETTCPSGVEYGRLVDLGRVVAEQKAPRPVAQKLVRWSLRQVLPYRARFGPLFKIGQLVRPVLPKVLKQHIPPSSPKFIAPKSTHQRVMLSLPGCAQASAAPNTDIAAAQVLDKLQITLKVLHKSGCCGAINHHLNDHEKALEQARHNIDLVWPELQAGAEAVVVTASGCGATLQEYGHMFRHDTAYADKAKQVSKAAKDIVEILAQENLTDIKVRLHEERLKQVNGVGKIAVHCPCTQQHAMQLPHKVKALLDDLGFDTADTKNDHLCCGSAGTYSLLQPKLSHQLRNQKITDLTVGKPQFIVTANIGCQLHLGGAGNVPVKHWLELLAT